MQLVRAGNLRPMKLPKRAGFWHQTGNAFLVHAPLHLEHTRKFINYFKPSLNLTTKAMSEWLICKLTTMAAYCGKMSL